MYFLIKLNQLYRPHKREKNHKTNKVKITKGDYMFNLKWTLALSMLISSTSFSATLGVYQCQELGSQQNATLVYSALDQSLVWMPDTQLKTTKANAKGKVLGSGKIQFLLFGFQDQGDFLILPTEAQSIPQKMDISTYHDNDDLAEDIQNFTCTQI